MLVTTFKKLACCFVIVFAQISFAQQSETATIPAASAISALPKNIIDDKLLDNLKNCKPYSLDLPPKTLSTMIENLPEGPEKNALLRSSEFIKFLQTLNINYEIVGMNNNICVVRVKVSTPDRSSTMECHFPKEDLLLIYQYAFNAMHGKYDQSVESNVRNSFKNCKKMN